MAEQHDVCSACGQPIPRDTSDQSGGNGNDYLLSSESLASGPAATEPATREARRYATGQEWLRVRRIEGGRGRLVFRIADLLRAHPELENDPDLEKVARLAQVEKWEYADRRWKQFIAGHRARGSVPQVAKEARKLVDRLRVLYLDIPTETLLEGLNSTVADLEAELHTELLEKDPE